MPVRAACEAAGAGESNRPIESAWPAVPCRRQDRRSIFDAEIDPGFQIGQGVNDATADFPVLRPGPVGPMLLERSGREAKKTRTFWGAQKAWRPAIQQFGA